MKYRMYVDEVGNPDLGSSNNPNHRYLNLTAVIIELSYVKQAVFPRVESLKEKYFDSHPDDPVIFHRKELVNKKHPFESLRNPQVEADFNAELLQVLRSLDYVVLSVTIDKQEHRDRYQVWRFDPYHYCLAALVERYVMWLRRRNATGDVMAESRGGKEDRRLKSSFKNLYEHGSEFMSSDQIAGALTSCQLKVKPKQNNISGLQLADLIAHPVYKAMIASRNNQAAPVTFGSQIVQIIEDRKFDRSSSGKLEGWGMKWLP